MSTNRQPKGVPVGGQFAAATHAEPGTVLTRPAISVPSSPELYRLAFEDSPSNAERRGYGRQALEQSLDGDEFDVVNDQAAKEGIREEAQRDDSVDRALHRVLETNTPAHHFGAAMARELKTVRDRRLKVESHYVPTAQATFEAAAPAVNGSAEEYRQVLQEVFPHVGDTWYDAMLAHHGVQPESWQRRELYKLAVSNEMLAASKAPRPEVGEEDNPDFTSHPVTPLESRIDGLIFHRGDPTSENNIRYLANSDEGTGYGTVHIKQFARMRLAAYRHQPVNA